MASGSCFAPRQTRFWVLACATSWLSVPGEDSAATPLVATPEFAEGAPALSPDGRWLAYSSNETGSYEVFVRPLPDVNSTQGAGLEGRGARAALGAQRA